MCQHRSQVLWGGPWTRAEVRCSLPASLWQGTGAGLLPGMLTLPSPFPQCLTSALHVWRCLTHLSMFFQRRDVITGTVEPTDEECEWQSDREEEEDDLAVSWQLLPASLPISPYPLIVVVSFSLIVMVWTVGLTESQPSYEMYVYIVCVDNKT